MVIYKATNIYTGLCYVGQTIQKVEKRIADHGRDPSGFFGNAIKKYGLESFSFEIIDSSARTVDELNFLERKYIKELNTIGPNGYNLQIGGLNSIVHKTTREKLSYSRHTPIDCKCIVTGITYSFRNISQVSTMNFCPKMVQNSLKYRGNLAHNFQWKYREDSFKEYSLGKDFKEFRRNFNDYKRSGYLSNRCKSVIGISIVDGHELRLEFMKDIEGLGGSYKHLGAILNGKRPYNPYKDYYWRFE